MSGLKVTPVTTQGTGTVWLDMAILRGKHCNSTTTYHVVENPLNGTYKEIYTLCVHGTTRTRVAEVSQNTKPASQERTVEHE